MINMKKEQHNKQRPEALAEFAESARASDPAGDDKSLNSDEHTNPIPVNLKKEQEIATRILAAGAKGEKPDPDEAGVDELPDRIVESR